MPNLEAPLKARTALLNLVHMAAFNCLVYPLNVQEVNETFGKLNLEGVQRVHPHAHASKAANAHEQVQKALL